MKTILITTFRFIFFGIIFAVAAWISVHLLAIFGVFLAIGLVFWWFIFPQNKICFLCLLNKRHGADCKYCFNKKYWASIVISFLIIIILTLISIGVVYLESIILLRAGFPGSPKTVSFVIPPKSQHRIGEIFPVEINLTGIEVPINAVQADIGFDPSQVNVVEVSTKNSFANIFIQKEINNDGGWARLTGGLPNPGYYSDRGLFGTIFFQAKIAGLTEIRFLTSSMVLANDGRGSNVLKSYPQMTYLIIPDRLTPDELRMQSKLLTTAEPTPVLGAHTALDGGSGTQLSFIASAPKIPVTKDKILGATISLQDEPDASLLNKFLVFLQKTDDYIWQFWRSPFVAKQK